MSSQLSFTTGKAKRKRSTSEVLSRFAKKIKGRSYRADRTPSRQLRAGFPKSTRVILTYSGNGNLQAGIGALAGQTFSCNSLYDPDRSIGGHQPSNFDMWAGIYQHYCVLKSTIVVTFLNPVIAQTTPNVVGINLTGTTTLPSTSLYTTNVENGAIYKPFPSYQSEKVVLTHHFDAAQFFDVPNPRMKDEICAVYNGDPVDEAFFILWWGSMSGAATTDVYWDAKITYTAIFYEIRNVAQS